jgi:glucokinase
MSGVTVPPVVPAAPQPEGPVPVSRSVIACDVGGTGIKAALVDAAGRLYRSSTVPTPLVVGDGEATAAAVLDTVAGLATRLSAATELAAGAPAALGIVVPGLVDADAGIARYSENLRWRDVPFTSHLTAATGLAVAFDHDVRAAGAAEQQFGAGRDWRDVAFIPIGTGISAAFVLDGRPYAGGGWAGEIGHIDVGSGLPCPCGGTGCLETVASAAAIRRRYTERSGRAVDGALDVVERLACGDTKAASVWDEAVEALATALAISAALVAPELVVIGGGLSGAGDVLLEPLRHRLSARLTLQRRPELRIAALGDQAGLLGAALLAWRQAGVVMQREPGSEPGHVASGPSVTPAGLSVGAAGPPPRRR